MDRVPEIDFAKGVLIFLMVMCHVTYFGFMKDVMWDVSHFVYSFHMSGFFIISGYLLNINKDYRLYFNHLFRRIVIPYLLFNGIYCILIYIVKNYTGLATSNNNSFELSWKLLSDIILVPNSTYWYLQNLAVSMCLYYVFVKFYTKSYFISIIFSVIAILFVNGLYDGYNVFYAICFIAGAILRRNGIKITVFFYPSFISLLLMFILAFYCKLSFSLYASAIMTVLGLSVLFKIYEKADESKIVRFFTLLGYNTLSLVVFSSYFTGIMKNLFNFGSGWMSIIGGILSLFVAVSFSLLIAKIFDICKLSSIVFGVKSLYHPIKK
ncbi:acyltransferase family protein [Coprobacter sp.]